MNNDKIHYVYEFHDPRKYGTPVFYVGKGSGDRINVNKKRNKYCVNKMKKIGFKKVIRIKVKLFYGTDAENKAYKYEQFLIDWYGLENLCNVHLGGNGFLSSINHPHYNKHFSEEHRKNISESRKGKYCKENNSFFGKTHTKEAKEKMSKNHYDTNGEKNPMFGKCHSDVTKQKMNIKNAGSGNPNAKLDWEKVDKIRELYYKQEMSIVEISKIYNVSQCAIWHIVHFKRWNKKQ